MILAIIVVLFSLIILTGLHELGHFVFAKKFNVKVEEFGIGYPPRIIGKKIGETIYSLNLLPFGAFVKILGEDGDTKDPRSFSQKTILQRAIILVAGVVMFWIIAIVILTFVSGIGGVPTSVPDDLDVEAEVMVLAVLPDSPADTAGMKAGDIILEMKYIVIENIKGVEKIDRVEQVIDFTTEYENQDVILSLKRGGKEIEVPVTLREKDAKDGTLGISLARVSNMKTTWYKAPILGVRITYEQTKAIPRTIYKAIVKKIRGEKVTEIQIVGPIGVGQMLGRAVYQSWGTFFMLISMISIWLALFNLLPIPALDGGRLLFLIIEAIRRKPMSQKIEQGITASFFFLLIAFMIVVTLRDILNLF